MTETYGSIRAPSIRLEVFPSSPGYLDLDGRIEIDPSGGMLRWSLYDGEQLMFQSVDYTVSLDGSTATFSHTFPPNTSGDTYTIKQDVMLALS